MRLVQIVPELPPAIGGIGDYASLLARELRRLGLETTFVIPERPHLTQVEAPWNPPEVSPVLPRPHALTERLDALRPDAVLLHYSGYGYAQRGAPVWLVEGLRRWKASASDCRLVVMFHELWACGPPWRSSFWLCPLQRALVAALLRLADAFLTSTDLYARRLRRLAPHRSPLAVLPVLSNIGEPDEPLRLDVREPLAVVFGRPGLRRRVYAHIEDFLPALRSAGIDSVLDIGPPLANGGLPRSPLSVVPCGYLDPASASAAMLCASFGLLDYPLEFAAKSGILAAYAAHGLVPLVRGAAGGAGDRLRHGLNLVRTSEPMPELKITGQRLATEAHLWYRDHCLEQAAATFARALDPLEAPS